MRKMYKIEVPATIQQIILVYYRFGIWRNKEESLYFKWTRRSIYIVFQFTFLLSLAVGAFQSNSMDDSILLAALVLQCSILNVKMIYALLKGSEIFQFIHDIGVYTIHDHKEFLLAKSKLKLLMDFARFFVGMSIVAAFLLLTFPLFSKTLPLNISFPLDWRVSRIAFMLAYVYLLLEMVLNVVSSLLTIFIWFLMMNCSIQYRKLKHRLRFNGSNGESLSALQKSSGMRSLFLQDLIESIKIHRNIKQCYFFI